MPIDDLTILGNMLRAARKEKNFTQQQLADESHISIKEIADIEKGRRNPSYLIMKTLAKVLHFSLDSLIRPELTPDEAGQNEMKLLYLNCPPEMRETLLHHTRGFTEELKELSVHLSVFRYNGISYHDWGDWEGEENRQVFMMEVGMFVQKLVSGQAEKGLLSMTEIQAVCKALGDGSRCRILELALQKGKMYLQELSKEIGLTPATVSHHISVLMEANLLQMEVRETEKKIIHYTVNQRQLAQIADTFRQMAEEV